MEILDHPILQKYAKTCRSGAVILTEGDKADSLYILVEGSLDIIKGGKKIHEINIPGSFFGELSFLLGTERIASVIAATENTRFLCLPNSDVDGIWEKFPEFARQLARNLAKRLYETTNVAQGFREFCDQMPDAVIMTSANYTVLSWNRAAEKLYGRLWHQMRGKSIVDIYDNQAAFKQFMAELNAKGAIREKTLKISHPAKEWFFVSTSTTILKDPHNHVQGYLFLGRDATSLHKLEKKQQRIIKWIAPMLLTVALLAGWLCLRQPAPVQTGYHTAENLTYATIIDRLNHDAATLELAVSPALKAGNQGAAIDILTEYFSSFQPEMDGMTGVLLLNDPDTIFCGYLLATPENKKLSSQKYQGTKFSEYATNASTIGIYMVSRPESAGGEGVEMVVALRNNPGLLAFRLDMGLIKQKYGFDINGLARAINRN